MREATSRVIMEGLWQRGTRVQAYDPQAMKESKRIYGDRDDLSYFDSKDEALVGADALIICTEWKHFWAPDFDYLYQQLGDKTIFDGRNIYNPENMAAMDFNYYGIGRGMSLKNGE